jgi:hypothetical protein
MAVAMAFRNRPSLRNASLPSDISRPQMGGVFPCSHDSLCLSDDVLTTGATATEAAQAYLQAELK